MVHQPQFLLICDSNISTPAMIDGVSQPSVGVGKWHFVLESIDGTDRLEASDLETYIHQDRLALLAVVRGLEALEQSSLVRLLTTSRYVDRGLRFGLQNWRDTHYRWESFGVQKPIRNADLWQRVDLAMQYHDVSCRLLKSHGLAETTMEELCSPAAFAGENSIQASAIAPAVGHHAGGGLISRVGTKPALSADNHTDVELVARYQPNQVIFRVDPSTGVRATSGPSADKTALQSGRGGPRRPHFLRNQQSSTTRPSMNATPIPKLQWWEMASNWESPLTAVHAPQHDNCVACSAAG